jgi:hypothetical protein
MSHVRPPASILLALGSLLVAAASAASPGVVLHQTHTFSGEARVDTLTTYITATHVRVSHPGGDAILDLGADRISILDAAARQYRQTSLRGWERSLRQAVESVRPAQGQGPIAFEAMGDTVRIAGQECQRFMLFTRRELIPGEVDFVEQQIWVTQGIAIPKPAYDAYAHSMGLVASIGLGSIIQRPAGVIMRTETVTRPEHNQRAAHGEIESIVVFRVEKKDLGADVFAIPPGYVLQSDSLQTR